MVCDLAETYGVLDYRKVPTRTLGALVVGLGSESRLGRELAGIKASPDHILLGRIYDAVNILLYSYTKDAKTGRNRPESYVERLIEKKSEKDDVEKFRTGADFDKAWKQLTQGG